MAKRQRKALEELDEQPEVAQATISLTFPEIHLDNTKLTDRQKSLVKLGCESSTRIVFVDGPAGTTKTWCAVYCALRAMKRGQVEKFLYVRTAVESSDNRMGYLPGDVGDKFNAYTMPMEDKLAEFLKPADIKALKQKLMVQALPVNFLRGLSWSKVVVVLDEAQNLTVKELKTFLTRIGEDCLVFVAGDHTQSDIGDRTGFNKVLSIFDDEESRAMGIHVFRFTHEDIMRGAICKYVTTKFSQVEKLFVNFELVLNQSFYFFSYLKGQSRI